MIERVFGVLEKVDETARALAGVAVDFANGLAADVRRTKEIALMAKSLASEIGWSRVMAIFADVFAERIG